MRSSLLALFICTFYTTFATSLDIRAPKRATSKIRIDDQSSVVKYAPGPSWRTAKSSQLYGGSRHLTTSPGAKVIVHFTGTGIQWWGSTSPTSCQVHVWINNQRVARVTLFSPKRKHKQKLWSISGLKNGPHKLLIINTGTDVTEQSYGREMDVDSFVIETPAKKSKKKMVKKTKKKKHGKRDEQWQLQKVGSTGISAMQVAVVDDSHMILIDKVEHNPLQVDGHSAWGAIYNLDDNTVRPLDLKSNSFCAGGSFLSNGTFVNVGGNPTRKPQDYGDVNGLQAIRLYHPCNGENCDIYEDPQHLRMASPRWYASVVRIADGSLLILGGMIKGGFINSAAVNNPTYEFYPAKNVRKSGGLPIPLPFLAETLNANLFPIAIHLPSGKLFLAANTQAIVFDPFTGKTITLPDIPNGVKIAYPMTASAVLLPLTPDSDYTPEVLICGGSTVNDLQPGSSMSSQAPASSQCIRMVLNVEGIRAGWEVEQMPQGRVMPDLVMLPDSRVLIVNGAQSGVAGYGNVKDLVGQSNADNPAFTPVIYDPSAPAGERFSSEGMPTSDIARLYHSVATLTPNGDVFIAGSNPNLDVVEGTQYPTELESERLSPPYIFKSRPIFYNLPEKILYDREFQLGVSFAVPPHQVEVVIMDMGFVTHSVHMNSRLVQLVYSFSDESNLQVIGPPNADVYPPGMAWLWVVADGVPSVGRRVMIGDGRGPPVDEAAIKNALDHTEALAKAWKGPKKHKQG